jgi:hypothetical protein
MPVYLAGYVNGNATIRFGLGFTLTRMFVTGSYRITIPVGTSPRFFAPVATSVGARTVARIAQLQKDGVTGNFLIDVEIWDPIANAPVDGDFTFIAVERS